MLVILTTHPIQYQVPLWRELAKTGEVSFEVWYLSDHGARAAYDSEFGQSFAWDLDMLEGYPHRFLYDDPKLRVDKFFSARLSAQFRDMLREKEVKALWIQGWQVLAYWQAVWAAHSLGIPVWLRGESNDMAPQSLWKCMLKQYLYRMLFKRINNFLYIGSGNRRLYERFGVDPASMYPAPYCVENERFAQQAAAYRIERERIRASWNIPQEAFCVLFAGKFIAKKRPLDLVAAAGLLGKPGERPFHLLFVGAGELEEVLKRNCDVVFDASCLDAPLSGDESGQPKTSFVGFLNQREISRAYIAADCLVLPSDYGETWGLVVNEAMASGLPCVVSDACGCGADLVAPLRKDLVFPLGNVPALAAALESLANNYIDAAQLWEIVDEFKPTVAVQSVIKLYLEAVKPDTKDFCIHEGRAADKEIEV